ncbi:MAG: hypothetical protein OEL55_03230 [Desulfobulbaceae bacterium]|nr:hypothetical protein [Desulfobulbaceae bacterium]
MYKNLFLGALLLVMCPGLSFADSLQIGFNDSSAQIEAIIPTQQDFYGSTEVNFRGLYSEESDTKLASAGLNVLGNLNEQSLPGLLFGAGVKIYGGKSIDDEILSMALGGIIKTSPAAWQGLGLSASYFYSPKVFTTLDSKRMAELETTASFEFIPNKARVFLSYNNIRTDFDIGSKRTLDESVRVGISLEY